MQTGGRELLHLHELPHGGVLKPREIFEGNKKLVVSRK